MIDLKTLKEKLDYNEETGIFVIKGSRGGVKDGAIAGCVNPKGYIMISIMSKQYRAHRLAWLFVHGVPPKNQLDHINGIKTDNRIINLRDVNNEVNHKNMKINSRNKSGTTGVCWDKRARRWSAEIRHLKKKVGLGSFINLEDAIAVRQKAEKEFGYHENHGRLL